MSNKIPVGDTIAKSYNFVIEDFLPILGIIWFPGALMTAAGYWLSGQVTQNLQDATGRNDLTQLIHALPFVGLGYLAVLLLVAMQYLGVTELALGMRGKRTFFYFSLGKTFWLLIAAWFLVFLLLVGVEIGIGIASGISAAIFGAVTVAAGAHPLSGSATGIMLFGVFAVVALFYCAFLYATVRLTYLLPPAVVAEKKIAIGSAWSLSRGNFGRIVVIWLAVTLPALFVIQTIEFTLIFPTMMETLLNVVQHPGPPGQIWPIYVQMIQKASSMAHAHWYILYPVGVLLGVIYFGLTAGAHAFAYRALVPGEETKAA